MQFDSSKVCTNVIRTRSNFYVFKSDMADTEMDKSVIRSMKAISQGKTGSERIVSTGFMNYIARQPNEDELADEVVA